MSSYIKQRMLNVSRFRVAANGSQLCEGWAFEKRQPDLKTKPNRITNDAFITVCPTIIKLTLADVLLFV